ncbi:TIGR02677 family protein [Actinokineospora diospyrosa]|uniref:TIGR02677 family protein n=1 Tax=Actinokineospora diospyrosa TaxID=103728 RepID=A0ABT1ILA9_9PSEU|nr:TIGR02677 family protein [Actinokineospora diospyrosa]
MRGCRPVGLSWPAVDDAQGDAGQGAAGRLQLYAYLQPREHHHTYLAIMRLFTSTLLADLSAGEVSSALAAAERDGRIDIGESHIDVVIPRLRQLVEWGNLVHGRRETIAASIAEFQQGSMRYQVSKLAVRVQRDVDELLRVPEGAREVSRELLPAIERGLGELGEALAVAVARGQRDPGSLPARRAREQLAERVTTLFLQHAELAATVRDFYAYLGQILTRHHLAPEEIAGFRNLLVEYIQVVVEDVLRHTPAIATALSALARSRAEVLRLLRPAEQLGTAVERTRGRGEADWQELTDWFVDRPGNPSQVTALREATTRAIGALLATVRRATTGGGLLPSRRAELVRLAGWLDTSTPKRAHAVYAAAFGLHSARNLLPAPEHDGDDEHTPWRDGPAIDVSVSVRGRGDRGARGRTSRIMDDPITEQGLLAQAREADEQREAAAAELAAAAANLDEATLSGEALSALCELLTLAMAQREGASDPGSATDQVRGLALTLTPQEGQVTRIRSTSGTLTLRDTVVGISRVETRGRNGR